MHRRFSLCLALLVITACGGDDPASRPAPPRGVVLISLDTLRADRLGCYGNERDTSPFLDSLAASGTLFEHAVAQYPNTLPSHMSILTGLYPAEHGVYPPDALLAERLVPLPEALAAHGFRTAGFTEGGFARRRFFARGFERFDSSAAGTPRDVETTFARGLDFLAGLREDERFFLFLQTYAVHAPYAPPAPYPGLYWKGEPPPVFAPEGSEMLRYNAEGGELPAATRDYFLALYDAGVRYLDDQLRELYRRLEELGLAEETALVVLSDHGEEILEHGKLGHTQVYDESLRVPLIITVPVAGGGGHRVGGLVETVDVAPTLYDLLAVPPTTEISGRSLAACLGPGPGSGQECTPGREAYAESRWQRTLYQVDGDRLWQLVVSEHPPEAWVSRRLEFDAARSPLRFEASSFEQPRTLEVSVDGVLRREVELGTGWSAVELDLPAGAHTVRLETADCSAAAGEAAVETMRWQCFSFRVRGVATRRFELFDLSADPGAQNDLARRFPERVRAMYRRLGEYATAPLAAPTTAEVDDEALERLRALGYIQ